MVRKQIPYPISLNPVNIRSLNSHSVCRVYQHSRASTDVTYHGTPLSAGQALRVDTRQLVTRCGYLTPLISGVLLIIAKQLTQ